MSDIVIKAEGLSKSYIIGHNVEREKYITLRDVITKNVKGAISKTTDLFKGKAIISGDVMEEFWALQDVNFEINRGDAVGIIGRNGAGKSTLLKVLSRITEPSAGRVTLKGRIASLLEVGTGFHPELSGRDNIYLNGAILGMSRNEIRSKFDEIVDFAGVEKFLDTPVKKYSSGMYVRLAFAVSAYLESEILIVDEVLAVGDAEFQKKCLGKMGDVSKKDGRTVLFVSHNITSIKALCQKGIYLLNGNMAGFGKIDDVVSLYKDGITGAFNITADTKLTERISRCASGGAQAGAVRLSFAKITDEDFKETAVFQTQSQLLFELHYEVFDDVDNLQLVLRFESADTYQTITSNTFLLSDKPLKKGTTHKIVIKLKNITLQAGEYLPYIVLMGLNKQPFDVIDKLITNVPIIEIRSNDDTAQNYLSLAAEFTTI